MSPGAGYFGGEYFGQETFTTLAAPAAGTLPTIDDFKNWLQPPILDTSEDRRLTLILAQAQARVLMFLGLPYTAVAQTMYDDGVEEEAYTALTQLLIPLRPVDVTQPITVTNQGTGQVIDPTTFTVDGVSGIIRAIPGTVFPDGRNMIVATVGWSAHPHFLDWIAPVIANAILDLATEYYNRLTAGVDSLNESSVSVGYTKEQIPARIKGTLESLRHYVPGD